MTLSTRMSAAAPLAIAAGLAAFGATMAQAVEINLAAGAVGRDIEILRELVKPWEEATGNTVSVVPMPSSTSDQFAQFRLWLAAGTSDVDLYQTDVIWAPQLAEHFVDLTAAAAGVVDEHFPAVIQSQTVDGKLVAMPLFTDAPALYYRTDLLEKHGAEIPTTWEELTATAQTIMDAEHAEGNTGLYGYVFQGNAYEGLTCNALEWIKSFGGGQIVEADGEISVFNDNAVAALEQAAAWIGTVAPEGVLSYQEEEARGLWQTGNAVFMRNWPYAYALGNSEDSPVKGKFGAVPLPSGPGEDATSAAALGGWNIAVSKYSENVDVATELALFMSSAEAQKFRAIQSSQLPTVIALYDDPEIAEAQPIIPGWKEIFLNAVPRPSAPTKEKYNEVSATFWSAVHDTLSGRASAAESLEVLQIDLEDLKGGGW